MKAETNAGFVIERVEVHGVAVPLAGGGFKNAYLTKTVQKSAIVRVFAVDGSVGLGNIDPSPGYSTETIDESLGALRTSSRPRRLDSMRATSTCSLRALMP